MTPFGSRAPYAKARNEPAMKHNLTSSVNFPDSGQTSTAWMHKKLMAIQRGNAWNVARTARIAQENIVSARLNEERQLSELTTGRRENLQGEGGRVRVAQRAAEQAEQVINGL